MTDQKRDYSSFYHVQEPQFANLEDAGLFVLPSLVCFRSDLVPHGLLQFSVYFCLACAISKMSCKQESTIFL